jgi:phosphate-selective porin OprO/OprP
MPELPFSLAELSHYQSPGFSFQLGMVALLDHTGFRQDSASLAQVGEQQDRWQARAARMMARGTVGVDYKVGYLLAAEYKGFDSNATQDWSLTDASLAFPLGGPATKLTLGKTKETFGYEMVGDAANLPHQERVLSPFYVSRNTGLRLQQVVGADQRVTWALGVYNNGWLNGSSGVGTHVTARVTGLVWDEDKGRRFLHLGLAARRIGADDGKLRYQGRPETNVGSNYVDSGSFAAHQARHLGLEALWNEGPVSVLAELHRAWVDAPASGNPVFGGYYVVASWIVTGETRPYDRTVGYARRVMPAGYQGAIELVARYSNVDIDDAAISGGRFHKTYLGANWWATPRWKFGIGWGRTWLDRFGSTGVTDSVLTRAQWVM